MSRLRVLIIDDNVSFRRVLYRALEAEPGLDLVGTSGLGEAVLDRLKQIHPDRLILGLSTPANEVRTLCCLDDIKSAQPHLPILVVSPFADRGSPISIESICRGAAGCQKLPALNSETDLSEWCEATRGLVAPKLLQMGKKSDGKEATPTANPSRWSPPRRANGIEAIAIGVSTGGPNVLATILAGMPADLPVPIFIVQHMLPTFTQSLADRLNAGCPLTVLEATEGSQPRPGTVWIAPGNRHMEVVREGGVVRLHLTDAAPENSCRPAADVLFRSAARAYGSGLLAVVLTGMGSDGLRGCREVKDAGGTILVQDEATSVVWGMPGHVAQAGLAQEVLAVDQIASGLLRRVVPNPASSRPA